MMVFLLWLATAIGVVVLSVGGIFLAVVLVLIILEALKTRLGILGQVIEYIYNRRAFRYWLSDGKGKEEETIKEAVENNKDD